MDRKLYPTMPLPSADPPSSSDPNNWVIILGWLGFVLWNIELLSSYAKVEIVDSTDLRTSFHILQIGLGWLWPIALVLNFRASTLRPVLRYLLMSMAAFLAVPAFFYSLLFLGVYWIGQDATWQDKQVLYQSTTDADVRIAAQSRDDGFATSYPQQRIVKLTPLLDLWQFAEPVDTSCFKATGWKRVGY
ncbi:hypothetical protein [Hymenobacter yonginensis]|uniref:Uncharacterized protein n=1 Tax=Hymenobacter yonginensis TaxID=748197 RepID=A0ABY7PKM2_9BACT|nr:hypothetical protein [Hymenobacter yonginensis]WBO83167.1 hypothetical protein O9Z63_12340 [Hymenobacter yonginensis]